jgi:hypothetical protein
MAVRALVFIEDNTAARVIAARLERDGLGCIVVARPGALVEEARRGPVVLVVQSQYSAGDVGAALLRQVRVARGDVAPAVVVVVGDLAAPDRHVLERQWKVQAFVPQGAPTQAVIEAVHSAARSNDPGRPGVRAGGFDLVAGTTGPESDMTVDAAAGNNDPGPGEAGHTVVMPESQLQFLRHRPGHDVTGPLRTSSDESDLSQLPPPGGDNDIALDDRDAGASSAPAARRLFRPPAGAAGVASSDFAAATSPGMPIPADVRAAAALNRDRSSVLSTASPLTHAVAAAAAAAPPSLVPRPAADPEAERRTDLPGSSPPWDAEDAMQIQELQRTQAELKKALLAERRAHEAAQKRVEELEARLAKMGEEPASTTQGVPTEGVFEDLRYPALLARCRAEGFTGSIVLQTGGAPRTVFLKDGLPIAFSSSEPGQRIGKLLVAQGRITDEQYMKAATLMVERSIKLTDALVELRLIDAETLAVEQRNTTRDQIIQGFEVVQGRFQTHAGAVPDANTATFDFGPGEVYVQGYRRYAPASEMQATYETLRDRYLATNARLASYRSKLGLTGDDERFLRLLGEAYTVDEASERSGIAPEAVARLLAALQALDLVEEWSPGVEQFRARLRTERQRAAEELARVLQEATSREEKLLTAFQQALAAAGAASLETGDARGPGHRPATPATNTTRNDPLHPDRSTTSSPPQSASRSTAPGPSTASAGAGPGNSSTSSWGTGSGAAIAPAGPASVGGMAHASTANASMATTASPLLGSSAFSSSPSSPFSSSAVGATGAGSSSQGNAVLGTPAARLVGARLVGARLVGARLVGARLVGARLVGARPRGPGLGASGAAVSDGRRRHAVQRELVGVLVDERRRRDGRSVGRQRSDEGGRSGQQSGACRAGRRPGFVGG